MATYRVPVLQDFNWQPNVLDKDLVSDPAVPAKGDRYIVATAGGGWSGGAAKDIAWWDGAAWQFDTPLEGWQCWVEDENLYYVFDGTNWVAQSIAANTSNISSHTIQIASLESKQVVDRASIDSVETIGSANASNISSHTIQIAATISDISSHTIQIASLESKQVVDRASIDSVETIGSANASNISSHTIQIASNESNISSHTVEIASAQKEGTYVSEYGAIEFTI